MEIWVSSGSLFDRGEREEVTHADLIQDVWNDLVSGMKPHEFFVSYCSLTVFFIMEIGVSQLQLGKDGIFAVWIVFLELLEIFDRGVKIFLLHLIHAIKGELLAVLSIVEDFDFPNRSSK